MSLFASVETDTLPLTSDPQLWIKVKRELTAGDARQVTGAAMRSARRTVDAQGENEMGIELDFAHAAFVKVATYLVDWNLKGPDGKDVDIASWKHKVDALRALSTDGFAQIEALIDQHQKDQDDQKKVASGARG